MSKEADQIGNPADQIERLWAEIDRLHKVIDERDREVHHLQDMLSLIQRRPTTIYE